MMAKQSKAQGETVERVLHEYKQGTLKTSAGETVDDRRQAVAIALSEAGESNRQTPAQNRKRLRDTKRRESAGATADQRGGPTKAALYEQARKRDIPGRSAMSKAELRKALEG